MSFRLQVPDVNKEILRTCMNLKKSKAVKLTGSYVQYSVIKQKKAALLKATFFPMRILRSG
jgi:hypothetical protein